MCRIFHAAAAYQKPAFTNIYADEPTPRGGKFSRTLQQYSERAHLICNMAQGLHLAAGCVISHFCL